MFDTLKRLILPDNSLHCPRCDKSFEGHDEAACARRMSRRFFFQVAAGAAVVIAAAPLIGPESLSMSLDDFNLRVMGPSMKKLLSLEDITYSMLEVLHNNTLAARVINSKYDAEFADLGMKIGDTIQIRKPARYLSA